MGYARKSHLSWRRVGEQTVVVDPEGKRLFGLNAAAGAIWHALDGARTAEQLTGLFDGEAEASDAERRRVVEAFLEGLERDGLVERGPNEPETSAPEAREPWTAPRVAWREEIQSFARACAFHPGQNLICNTQPRS